MIYLLFAVKALHVLAASAWFGHKLLIPGDLMQSLAAGEEQSRALVLRIERAERLGIVSGLITLVTGVAMIFLVFGGFGGAPVRIHIGLGLVVMMFGVGGAVAAPGWREVKGGVEAGDVERALAGARRLRAGLYIEQVVWVVVLVLMVVR